jgi:predicted phage baseplate assembly protein
MPLPTPNLDDRRFQDIVSEARSKIPLYCPKWTDYNLSDPGVTLIELFAWMVDMLLYRLNQVPDKNYIKFMELIGIHLQPPRPATVRVTFRLSAPQPGPVTISAGTEVATVRTETQDAIIFTTNTDATILLPTLVNVLTTYDDVNYFDVMEDMKNPYRETAIFQDIPRENNALYLGYAEDLSAHTLALTIKSSIEGIGVDPSNPPWAWEYWDSEKEKWLSMRLESDTTGGLNTSGQIILHIPETSGKRELDGRTACWIRCRATVPQPGQGEYSRSPIVRGILSETIGYTVLASHGSRTLNELLGESDGNPGQSFQLQNIPVLTRTRGETLEIETENEGEYEPWREVNSFADSGPDDPHFTCDNITGEIQFGPSIRQTSGEEWQYGKVPPAGSWIRFSSYRSGGGVIGNVGKGTITVLKSSIPYLASVTNFEAAKGGTDAETLERAKLRAPRVLRASPRAVTQEDYEYLALEASSRISRARCTTSENVGAVKLQPGTVRLLLVPSVQNKDGYLNNDDLQLLPSVLGEVQSYLDERRLLATRLEIMAPEYTWITVKVQARLKQIANIKQVSADIEDKICRYINPIIGGPAGNGWPFGRNLSLSDVYTALRDVNDIDYIQEIHLYPVKDGVRQEATDNIAIPPDGLACSYQHEVILSQ